MEPQSQPIPDLIRLTMRDPREAARTIMAMRLSSDVLWQGLALVVVLSVILAQVTAMLSGTTTEMDPRVPTFFASPVLLGFVQGCLLVMMVFAVHWVGRTFGGRGAFEDSIALVSWLQFLLVCLQAVQTLAMIIIPPLAGIIAIVGIVAFFFWLTIFICELHGFESPGLVFVMILVSMLAITFALSILLSIVGLVFVGGIPDV